MLHPGSIEASKILRTGSIMKLSNKTKGYLKYAFAGPLLAGALIIGKNAYDAENAPEPAPDPVLATARALEANKPAQPSPQYPASVTDAATKTPEANKPSQPDPKVQ